VDVEYRLARVAPAPAAAEDGLRALRFLAAQERQPAEQRRDRQTRVTAYYVRPGLPAILTIHGDQDQLGAGLNACSHDVEGGSIREFLKKQGLGENP